jgi:hypothetical protein
LLGANRARLAGLSSPATLFAMSVPPDFRLTFRLTRASSDNSSDTDVRADYDTIDTGNARRINAELHHGYHVLRRPRPLTAVTGVRFPHGTPLPNKTGHQLARGREGAGSGGLGQGGLGSTQADFGVADDHLIDGQAQVGFAEARVVALQGVTERGGEAGDAVRGDDCSARGARGFEQVAPFGRGLAGLLVSNVGLPTRRGGTRLGLRDRRLVCTCSKSSVAMIWGTATMIHRSAALLRPVRASRRLK